MSTLGTLLIDLSVANAKADRVLRKLYENAIRDEYDFENEEIGILRSALGFEKKPIAPAGKVGPLNKPSFKKPTFRKEPPEEAVITNPQALLDKAALGDPLVLLQGLQDGTQNIEHLHRAELQQVAHILGALETDTTGQTIKALRGIVATLLEATAIAPSAPTAKSAPTKKPITRIPFRLPKRLGQKAPGKNH